MVGLSITLVGVFVSVFMHGINPAFLFMELGSIIIVVFGCFGATISTFPFEVTQNMSKVISKCLKGGAPPPTAEAIATIVHMTNRAPTDGLLEREQASKGVDDEFLKKGL